MKLFSLLKCLNSRDKTKFRLFIQSPLYNKREDVKALYQVWMEEKGKSQLAVHYWQILYPQKPFSTPTWHLLTSRLFKLLEDFLAIQEMIQVPTDKKYFLAKAYRKLKQEKSFKKSIQEMGIVLEKQPYRSTHYLQQKHDMAYEEYDYIRSLNRKERTNLQEVSDSLDAYFLAAKFRQGCIALSRRTINQETYQIGLLKETLDYVELHSHYLDIPVVAVYYYCYKAITEEKEFYFLQLRSQIEEYQSQFPPSEIRDIYFVAINYCIKRLNTGTVMYVREAFELYRLSLNEGYLLEDGIMPESTFGNIVTLASKLKEYDWAKSFLDTFKNQLKPIFQQPLFHFSLAKLLYGENRLNESMQQLSLVETKAPFLFLGARTLQLKIFYELEEIELLDNLLDSLRVYLQRRKDLGYRRENYENLISFTKQLLSLVTMTKEEKSTFRNKVENTAVFTEKEWCLRMIG